MKKIAKSIAFFSVFFLILYGLLWFSLPYAVIVRDPSFKMFYENRYLFDFAVDLLDRMRGLRVTTVPADSLTDSDYLLRTLSKYKNASVILLSPVVTAAVKALDLDVTEASEGIVMGVSSEQDSRFDVVLVSDNTDAFAYARENNLKALDYRYVHSKDIKTFDAVIYPDLSVSVIPFLDVEKGTVKTGFLFYECRIL